MTALVEARAALAASEVRFRSLVATSSDVIVVLDEHDVITYASPALERVTGWRPDEVVGHCGVRIARAAGVDPDFEGLSAVRRLGGATTLTLRHRDGSLRHIEVMATDLLELSAVGGIVVTLRDVTERVEAQAAREAADARFRALVQNASDLIITFGPDRRVTYTSPAVTRLLGFGAEELLGMPGVELIDPGEGAEAMGRFGEVIAAGAGASAGPFETRLWTAAGGWCSRRGSPTSSTTAPLAPWSSTSTTSPSATRPSGPWSAPRPGTAA